MKDEKDNLDELFKKLDNTWDFEEPFPGHKTRFLNTIGKTPQKPFRYLFPVAMAASILLCIGLFLNFKQSEVALKEQDEWANVSPQVQETHVYFTSIIDKGFKKLEQYNNPKNKQIIEDAIEQMQKLDEDYEHIKAELIKNGENRQLIFAMLTNLKTRIAFLEEVLLQIDNNNKLNLVAHENNII